ncbi:hypothetical protein Micbo1qcDRAFT_233818 [Microdochium bolleyi]|uniref:Inner kinetochore subunit AME1 domain-containing protein n=1 Tax=Microdochium bolleyi TaxID=196109 RepID=A0A136J223_9PEZI|nr:hypothetical protein Micbo1qcDRAFT_233818 [Microdochium bolleyi]
MASAREDRMQSRMRGAGRHQVADDSFGFVLPAPEDLSPDSRAAANLPATQEDLAQQPPSPSRPAAEPTDIVLPDAPAASVRTEPNTSAKRRRLNGTAPEQGSSSSPRQPSSGSRTSARLRDAATNHATTVLAAGETASRATANLTRGSNPLNSSATKALSQLSLLGHSTEETPGATAALAALTVQDELPGGGNGGGGGGDDEEMELPPATRTANSRRPNGAAARILRSSPTAEAGEEVVGESPLDAPGSGRRQRVRQQLDQAASQSARLQRAVMEADERRGAPVTSAAGGFEPATSSPLARKTRRSSSTAGASQQTIPRSGRPTAASTTKTAAQISSSPGDGDIVDPLSSDPAPGGGTPFGAVHSSSPSTRSQTRRTAAAGSVRGVSSRNMVRNASSPGDNAAGGEASQSSPTLEAAKGKTRAQGATQDSATTARLGPKARRRAPVVPDSPEQALTSGGRNAHAAREQEEPEKDDTAEHVPDGEAAKRLAVNRKRSRAAPPAPSSPSRPSPELNSEPPDSARPAKRQRNVQQKSQKASPAKQAQPKPPRAKQQPNKKAPTKRRRRSSGGAEAQDDEAAAGNDVIPIVVQRYTRPTAALRRRQQERQNGDGGSDDDDDVLGGAGEIPYADRTGVNAVDVLTQMCEEVIDATLDKLQRAAEEAPSQAARKEFRVKLRALEAFQEELRTRLLEHTIALDSLHSLRKRVRAAQREKLTLRSEILRIRAERQEVALKMDAVRIRHEQENVETLHQLALSSTMHDIELAVENGKSGRQGSSGGEAGAAARMANLEVNISRLAEQACGGAGGGSLAKIREFNAMLERAAAVLEGR